MKLFTKLNNRGHIHLILPLIAIVLIAVIGGVVYMHLSSAASITNADYMQSGVSGKCLDDWHDGSTEGTTVDSYVCNKTAAQQWTVNSNGTIENANGKCLDNWLQKDANGNPIKIYDCSATDKAQQWVLTGNILKNPESGKCIDDPAFSTTNGKPLELYTCNGGSNQKWTPVAVSGKTTGTGGTGTTPTPSPTPSPTPKPTPTPTPTPTPVSTASTDGCTVSGVVAPCSKGAGSGTGASGWGAPSFDDEFNGSSLDTTTWNTENGWVKNGITVSASNETVSGGDLILTLASSSSGAEKTMFCVVHA